MRESEGTFGRCDSSCLLDLERVLQVNHALRTQFERFTIFSRSSNLQKVKQICPFSCVPDRLTLTFIEDSCVVVIQYSS